MNIVLVPCLAQCIASVQDGNFSLYAKWITILAFPNKTTVILSAFVMPLFDPILRSSRSLLFVLIWLVSTRYLSKLFRGIVTYGEFGVLNSIWTITFFEWSQEVIKSKTDITHAFISLSGVVGCVYTCWAVTLMKTHPWWTRLVCHILGPLTLLETSLWFKKKTQYTFGDNFPLSLKWLYEFLKSKENGYPRYVYSASIWILFFLPSSQFYVGPRYIGLLYWGTLLILSWKPTRIILGSDNISVVIRRKWFHLLAVALFGPATFFLPQLMSLSYAIALCILAVLENLRSDFPDLQSFYLTFADPTKEKPQNLLVSHIFLVLGCAMPHWISEYVSHDQSVLLLSWGVIVLGIGDAAGAMIGSLYGTHHWGRNQRTLEGSLAMWLSIVGIALLLLISNPQNFCIIAAATTLTTVLEAFTLQMDNLVLPLLGSIIILMLPS